MDSDLGGLTSFNNTVAVCLGSGEIAVLDAITGIQVACFSADNYIGCVAFSPDGTFLVSGGYGHKVTLWDVQTGGIVKTYQPQTVSETFGSGSCLKSVCISMDGTRIVSGSTGGTICLWDIHTGECTHLINVQVYTWHILLFPTNPEQLFSINRNNIQQWDMNGHMILEYDGQCVAFFPDNTQFIIIGRTIARVYNSHSNTIVAEVEMNIGDAQWCCFSPDGRLLAVASTEIIYIWDVTGLNLDLVRRFHTHDTGVRSLVFSPSSLISGTLHEVKFWQIGSLTINPVSIGHESTPPVEACIVSLSLHTSDGVVISNSSDGMVKVWDILTGLHKASFQTPATGYDGIGGDAQLIDGRLLLVWPGHRKIHVWDSEKGQSSKDTEGGDSLRIIGDGSRILASSHGFQVWSVWTWELIDEVKLKDHFLDHLCTQRSSVWFRCQHSDGYEDELTGQEPYGELLNGWDFGVSGASSTQLSDTDRPRLNLIHIFKNGYSDQCFIRDVVTKKELFRLSGKNAKPTCVQWDGQHLAAGYEDGGVLILDFCHLNSQ